MFLLPTKWFWEKNVFAQWLIRDRIARDYKMLSTFLDHWYIWFSSKNQKLKWHFVGSSWVGVGYLQCHFIGMVFGQWMSLCMWECWDLIFYTYKTGAQLLLVYSTVDLFLSCTYVFRSPTSRWWVSRFGVLAGTPGVVTACRGTTTATSQRRWTSWWPTKPPSASSTWQVDVRSDERINHGSWVNVGPIRPVRKSLSGVSHRCLDYW